jgi:hypothetical protein
MLEAGFLVRKGILMVQQLAPVYMMTRLEAEEHR